MKYGEALPSTFVLPKSAFWIKQDLIKNPFADLEIRRGDVVMDCGSYVGTFAAAAAEQGAGLVHCYEASSKTFDLLAANMQPYGSRAVCKNVALVHDARARAVLHMSGFDGANSIIAPADAKKTADVAAVNFRLELLAIRPDVIKFDIEGAEYDLFRSLSPGDFQSVRTVFVEFHPVNNRLAEVAAVKAYVRAEGLYERSHRDRAYIADRHKGQERFF